MAGKDRQTCPNVEMRLDSEHMCVHMHGVPEGDGRWWWALNGCTNQPEGWPLGPVVGQTALGAGMAGMDRWVQMWHDLARDGGGAFAWRECCQGEAWGGCWPPNDFPPPPKTGPFRPFSNSSPPPL